jgi:hypothetical protein
MIQCSVCDTVFEKESKELERHKRIYPSHVNYSDDEAEDLMSHLGSKK